MPNRWNPAEHTASDIAQTQQTATNLVEYRECGFVLGAHEVFDLVVGSGLLTTELLVTHATTANFACQLAQLVQRGSTSAV